MKIRQLQNQKGFTLIELAVVAAILVILAVVAMSTFTSTNQIQESEYGSMAQIAGAITAGAKAFRANQIAQGDLTEPYVVAESAGINNTASTANPFFYVYMDAGVTDDGWQIVALAGSSKCYRYDRDNNGQSTADSCISWDNTNGVARVWETGGHSVCNTFCDGTPQN